VTAGSTDPPFAAFPPGNSTTSEPKPARDMPCPPRPRRPRSATPGTARSAAPGPRCARGAASAAARAPRRERLSDRPGADVAPAALAAASDTSVHTLAGSLPPLPPARTSPGIPNIADSSHRVARRPPPPQPAAQPESTGARWITKAPCAFRPYGAAPWITKAPEGGSLVRRRRRRHCHFARELACSPCSSAKGMSHRLLKS
jgi:hypothetical protein